MSDKIKKFGTFGGVFTPSILTILGVIMYLRLGWVVGESGLFGALGIILLAHIISVSTGLSISSIATDKKIKTGGIYYMLSRSLGLPMGGAIGIALFVGTAFSISLYITGFTESFLALDPISEFLGMHGSIEDYRIIGTIVLILLGILAFISTSIAIKTQFLILGAILFSLISVFIGFFLIPDGTSLGFNLQGRGDGVPLAEVFAIFFPAVTGFTAGVAMSGDLKDPKKAIPKGTILAIVVGLVVYVALAFSFSYFVNQDTLLNNSNFLMELAWIPSLVIAGIWGATLSSALGGILGGPRILQAISDDKITPKVFAKGYGPSNEPRNALIFTLIIAEMGILLGELDTIARIVSMFYIAAYGFINLSFTLEKWASSDFRPSFRVSIWIGIIGFISSFAVMFKLDTVAMFAALIILMLVYWYIKQKKVAHNFGDVWQSVFSSIARTVLSRIDRNSGDQRNWRPNIILFSGGTKTRPHLIEFGKYLVGKQGFLSNFDLIQDNMAKMLFPKNEGNTDISTYKEQGIFTKRQACKDIYQGIEIIASTYGFSGVEPNTILLGWARQSEEPVKFAKMLNSLGSLDQNILLLDFDKEKGFGERKQIDIWWRGGGNNGSLVLSLIRFMVSTEAWDNAKVRLMIINPVNDEKEQLEINGRKILEHMRITNAEVRVINNEIEKRGLNQIIKTESTNTDLTFIGLPNVIEGKEQEFVDTTNSLYQGLGSVVMVKASSEFKELKIGTSGLNTELTKELAVYNSMLSDKEARVSIDFPQKPDILVPLEELYTSLDRAGENFFHNYINKVFSFQLQFIDELKTITLETYEDIRKLSNLKRAAANGNFLIKSEMASSFKIRRLFKTYRAQQIMKQNELMSLGLNTYLEELALILSKLPDRITNNIIAEELYELPEDSASLKRFKKKFRKRLKKKTSVPYDIHFKSFALNHLPERNYLLLKELIKELGTKSYHIHIKILKQSRSITESFFALTSFYKEKNLEEGLKSEYERIEKQFEALRDFCKYTYSNLNQNVKVENIKIMNAVCADFKKINANDYYKNSRLSTPERKEILASLQDLPEKWASNQELNFNGTILEWTFVSFLLKVKGIFDDAVQIADDKMFSFVKDNQTNLLQALEQLKTNIENKQIVNFMFETESFDETGGFDTFWRNFFDNSYRLVKLATRNFPEKVDLSNAEKTSNFAEKQFETHKPVQLRVSLLVDYIIQNKIFAPLRNEIFELPGILQKAYVQTQDITKLLTYHIEENQNDSEISLEDLVVEKIEELKLEIKKVEEHRETLHIHISQQMKEVTNDLDVNHFLTNSESLRLYIKEQEKIKRNSIFRKLQQRAKKRIGNQITQFWYKRSLGILFTKKIKGLDTHQRSTVADILNISDNLKIKAEVVKQIPFYYQQLFSRKQYYLTDFWVGRKKELEEGKQAIQRYLSGRLGAILVTGETDSGKSFFSQYLIQQNFENPNIITVSPPPAGSISKELFVDTLKRSLELYGDIDNIFHRLPEESVIIFEDIELWWEKSDKGFEVLDFMQKIIDTYSKNCLFVLNVNIHTYELINRFLNLDSYFLSKIKLGVFHTKEIQEVIMRRHVSSGMKFKFGNRSQTRFHSWNYARLFSRYFSISKGNIGVALYTWLRSIEEVKGQKIKIKKPYIPDTTALDYLSTESYILLLQILLHKRVSIDKMQRILIQPRVLCEKKLAKLVRSGLVVEYRKGIYELFPPLYPIIREKLQNKEIL